MSFGTMIDSEGSNLPNLLKAIGSNYPQTIASYVTGSGAVPATAQQFAELAADTGVFRYDQSPSLSEFAAGHADGADIENGAGTVGAAVDAARERETHNWYSWFYLIAANLADGRSAASGAKLARVRFIVADWNLSQSAAMEFLDDPETVDVDAVQWASPSSNPTTVCPGTSRTLAQLNVDLNVTRAGWFVKQSNTQPVAKTQTGIVVMSDLATVKVTSSDGKAWNA